MYHSGSWLHAYIQSLDLGEYPMGTRDYIRHSDHRQEPGRGIKKIMNLLEMERAVDNGP